MRAELDVRQGRVSAHRVVGATAGLVVAGLVVLLARPWLLPAGDAVGARIILFVALGLVGATWPVRRPAAPGGPAPSPAAPVLFPLTLGCLAFVLGRTLLGLPPRPEGLALALALNALAAVAEEAFFRRLVYEWLLPWGTAAAVVVSALLFAVAHVTVWGLWVLPLDLAAGLLLSWQRAATGRWSIPAATHVLANTLVLL